jgi:hypothetical protein
MKKVIITIVMHVAFLYALAAQSVSSVPVIGVEPRVYDFGVRQSGAPIKGFFTIKNSGGGELSGSIKSTCGCVLAGVKKFRLKGGESVYVEYTIATERNYAGNLRREILIDSNDGKIPLSRMVVKGLLSFQDRRKGFDEKEAVRELQSFDRNTLKFNNTVTVFGYGSYSRCDDFVRAALRRIHASNPSIRVYYYNLDVGENRNNLLRLKKEIGIIPDLPVIVYNGRKYCGTRSIEELLQ